MNNKPHFCPDWDFMLIYPTAPEMDACTCDKSDPPLQSGDEVCTALIDGEGDWVRIVESCKEPQLFRCKTGWIIRTECGTWGDSSNYYEVIK